MDIIFEVLHLGSIQVGFEVEIWAAGDPISHHTQHSGMWNLVGAAASGTALVLCYALYRYLLPVPLPGIPYNKHAAESLLGDIPEIKATKYRRAWIRDHPKRHGSAISQIFVRPFTQASPVVVVTDYREVLDICTRRAKEFDRGYFHAKVVGVVAPEFHFTMKSTDPRFKYHRELLRDLMTPAFLSQIAAPRVYERTSLLLSLWRSKMEKGGGQPFEASQDIFFLTLDSICAVAFGMEDMDASLRQELTHVQNLSFPSQHSTSGVADFPTAKMSSDTEALLDIAPMMTVGLQNRFSRLAQVIAGVVSPRRGRGFWSRRALIERQTRKSLERLKVTGEAGSESALDHLLLREMNAAQRAGREPDLYSPAIRDEVLGFLLAGYETGGAILSWWVKLMSKHQEIQRRLRAELRAAYATAHAEERRPSVDEMNAASIPYLDAVVEETLRCVDVVSMTWRTATCDTELLGCRIPKGTDVMLLLNGASYTAPAVAVDESLRSEGSRDAKNIAPAWGDDVAEFKPERWLKRRADEATGKEMEVFDALAGPMLTFLAGPRQCFGKKLGYVNLKTAMTLLVWEFEFGEVREDLNTDDRVEAFVNTPKVCYVKLAEAK
ncbi:cytochrome P450 [Stachybotrys elegans]|uniref:Cytochrome P450 n=1 Tax=Stachybotrys elegans TaxID=80388 RepID=A0A8K0SVD8_9HYPO|nr:cytochrome P450 [Stachybotrys elegans]